MPQLDYYFQVPRRYIPFTDCSGASTSDAHVHTFQIDFGTTWKINDNVYGQDGNGDTVLLYAETTGVPQESIIPVTIRQNEQADANTLIADYTSSSANITFADSQGDLLRFETVLFDTTNHRYQWWVEVRGSNFVTDGILLLRIENSNKDTRDIWLNSGYQDSVLPVHASGTAPLGAGDYVQITSLPSYQDEDSDPPYQRIHTLSFWLRTTPDIDSWKDIYNTFDENTEFPYSFPILSCGPIKVESQCFGLDGVFSTRIFTSFGAAENLYAFPGIEYFDENPSLATEIYGGSRGMLCCVSWWMQDNDLDLTRIPRNESSETSNDGNQSGNNAESETSSRVHIVLYTYLNWGSTSGHVHAVFETSYTEQQFEAMPLTIFSNAPYRVSEVRFPATDYFYNPQVSSNIAGNFYGIIENVNTSINYNKYMHKMENLALLLTANYNAQYLGNGAHEGEVAQSTVAPIPWPYPNRIQLEYQGLSGEQYL